ncbi:hypothetical protein NEOC95_001714 [Neochlamydia sp. AcF95]|nr:hypothetical protein [Neochlamydia sp. AcF95]
MDEKVIRFYSNNLAHENTRERNRKKALEGKIFSFRAINFDHFYF